MIVKIHLKKKEKVNFIKRQLVIKVNYFIIYYYFKTRLVLIADINNLIPYRRGGFNAFNIDFELEIIKNIAILIKNTKISMLAFKREKISDIKNVVWFFTKPNIDFSGVVSRC